MTKAKHALFSLSLVAASLSKPFSSLCSIISSLFSISKPFVLTGVKHIFGLFLNTWEITTTVVYYMSMP